MCLRKGMYMTNVYTNNDVTTRQRHGPQLNILNRNSRLHKELWKENAEYSDEWQNRKLWNKETNQSNRCHVEDQRSQVEMSRSLEERQQMDKEAHRMATLIWKKMQRQTETQVEGWYNILMILYEQHMQDKNGSRPKMVAKSWRGLLYPTVDWQSMHNERWENSLISPLCMQLFSFPPSPFSLPFIQSVFYK